MQNSNKQTLCRRCILLLFLIFLQVHVSAIQWGVDNSSDLLYLCGSRTTLLVLLKLLALLFQFFLSSLSIGHEQSNSQINHTAQKQMMNSREVQVVMWCSQTQQGSGTTREAKGTNNKCWCHSMLYSHNCFRRARQRKTKECVAEHIVHHLCAFFHQHTPHTPSHSEVIHTKNVSTL